MGSRRTVAMVRLQQSLFVDADCRKPIIIPIIGLIEPIKSVFDINNSGVSSQHFVESPLVGLPPTFEIIRSRREILNYSTVYLCDSDAFY